MTALIELIDGIIGCLISYLDTRDTISTQSDDLLFIDPVGTCLDGDTDDTRCGGFIFLLCFFESS